MVNFIFMRDLAIIFIFSVLFVTSAYEKWKVLSVPDWFTKQFASSFAGKYPSFLRLSYWIIAGLELLLALLFVASVIMPTLLPLALILSLFLFGILCFGLRISYDFQGSANMFTYFTATLVSLFLVTGR